MTTLASERGWLLDPNLLKLVHQCRRLIQSEFGVKLHLTEQHLEEQLADYASKSRSSHLAKTWETLTEKVPQLKARTEDHAAEDAPRRMYRGQPIADDRPASVDEKGNPGGSMPPRKKQVIYRGQVIG